MNKTIATLLVTSLIAPGAWAAEAVYANGLEIAHKAVDQHLFSAIPDVAFTPAERPATSPGVPIPYPNVQMSSDTATGTAKIELEIEPYLQPEAPESEPTPYTPYLNHGKQYFEPFSFDVKFEGSNVARHLDLRTGNLP